MFQINRTCVLQLFLHRIEKLHIYVIIMLIVLFISYPLINSFSTFIQPFLEFNEVKQNTLCHIVCKSSFDVSCFSYDIKTVQLETDIFLSWYEVKAYNVYKQCPFITISKILTVKPHIFLYQNQAMEHLRVHDEFLPSNIILVSWYV